MRFLPLLSALALAITPAAHAAEATPVAPGARAPETAPASQPPMDPAREAIGRLILLDGTGAEFARLLRQMEYACSRLKLPPEAPADFCRARLGAFDLRSTTAAITSVYAKQLSQAEVAESLAALTSKPMETFRAGQQALAEKHGAILQGWGAEAKKLAAGPAPTGARAPAAPPETPWVSRVMKELGTGDRAQLTSMFVQPIRDLTKDSPGRADAPDVAQAVNRRISELEAAIVSVYGDAGPSIAAALDSPEMQRARQRTSKLEPELSAIANDLQSRVRNYLMAQASILGTDAPTAANKP